MDKYKDFINANRRTIEKLIVIFSFFLILFIFFRFICVFISPFIIGYLISIFLEPIVKFLNSKFKLSRGLSAIISIIFMIFIIGGSITLIIMQLISQLKNFISNDTTYYFELVKFNFNKLTAFVPNLFFYIPSEIKEIVNEISLKALDTLLSVITTQLKVFGIAFIKWVPSFLVHLFIGMISSFFFIKDKYLIRNIIKNNTPKFIKNHYNNIKSGLSGAFLGYLKSQSIIMCVTFSISLFGLFILGNNYTLLLALCIALVDVLPLFGSGFILWPLAVLSFLTNDFKTGVGALVIYIVIQVTRQIIEPKILGNQIGLHPLITLMSIYIGVLIFGFGGIILGPMSVIIIKTIWNSNISL